MIDADFSGQAQLSVRLLAASPAWRRILELRDGLDEDLLSAVLTSAAEFASERLAPLNAEADRWGCVLEGGRVRVPEIYKDAWTDLAANGWIGVDVPESAGGQGLPLAVQTGCEMLFDRAAMAFCMLGGSTRCAIFVIEAHADAATRAEWSAKLASGERSATICISEADAGSDLGRVRTAAKQEADGLWRISGLKSWISFGDHDLTETIGHMVLARTGDASSGTRGLSLFLVPNLIDGKINGVRAERIEEKLGLHGSPTCVLRFDNAKGTLIGEPGRGLPQLFAMIERMRLLTAAQGAGIAMATLDIAQRYASERLQGGPPGKAPVPINSHADVQRQLAEIASRALSAQAFVLELAGILDLAAMEPDELKRDDHAALAAFLLPVAKNFGGETGFDAASRGIQVLGGAGYTREWPVEQYLRDTRILTIFEGTTGMQALDLLHRRLIKEEGRGLKVLATRMREEIAASHGEFAVRAGRVLDDLGMMAAKLPGDGKSADYGADAFLNAAWAVVSAWMGLRLAGMDDAQIAAAGKLRIHEAEILMAQSGARAGIPGEIFEAFSR